MCSCLIVQQIIPHYRIDFFSNLCGKCPGLMVVHSSQFTNDGKVQTLDMPFANMSVPRYRLGPLHWQAIVGVFFKRRPRYLVLGLELKHLANWLLWLIAPIMGTKVIWWTHGYNVHIKTKGMIYHIDRFLKTLAMKHAHRILLYTDYNKPELLKRGIAESKIIILNNALNEKPFQVAFTAASISEMDRINASTCNSHHTITFIGRLTWQKRPELAGC